MTIPLTDNAESIAGRIEDKNRFLDRYTWPSVMLIIFVAMNSDILLFIVSTIGRQLIDEFR